jgi:hypothetical protein
MEAGSEIGNFQFSMIFNCQFAVIAIENLRGPWWLRVLNWQSAIGNWNSKLVPTGSA